MIELLIGFIPTLVSILFSVDLYSLGFTVVGPVTNTHLVLDFTIIVKFSFDAHNVRMMLRDQRLAVLFDKMIDLLITKHNI